MPPKLIAQTTDIQGEENFPKGCAFSPDGLCVLTNTAADSKLRLYNTLWSKSGDTTAIVHEWKTVLSATGGDTVRSYAWYPHMKSNDPASCCFLATCRDQPAHLMDAYTGNIRATYRPYNALDEMESPTVVAFSSDGQKVVTAGFRTDRIIHVFDTAVPGRESIVLHLGKTRRSSDGQKGLVSAMEFAKDARIFCVGTYAPGSIYVYDDRMGQQPSGTVLNGLAVVGHGRNSARKKRHFASIQDEDGEERWLSAAKIKWFQSRAQGGVTQLLLDRDYILYSASRRSDAIICWDLRMLSGNPHYQSNPVRGLGSYKTDSNTNQRLEFDLDETGQTLYVGGRDKCVRIYDVKSGDLNGSIDHLDDVANGLSYTYNSSLNRGLLAVATGSRRFPFEEDLDLDAMPGPSQNMFPGYLRLYEMTEMKGEAKESMALP